MKIEILDSNSIYLFINSNYLSDIDFNSKEGIILSVKNIIIKYKNKLKLRGFYKVKVFVKNKVGFFIEIIKLDDNTYNDIVDLKVIVNLDTKVFFKTSIYDVLPSDIKIYYLDNYFYCDISDICNLYDVLEFGEYIYGNMANSILEEATILI